MSTHSSFGRDKQGGGRLGVVAGPWYGSIANIRTVGSYHRATRLKRDFLDVSERVKKRQLRTEERLRNIVCTCDSLKQRETPDRARLFAREFKIFMYRPTYIMHGGLYEN